MSQTTVRWIAIAIVGAMIAVVGVGVVSGGGDPDSSGADDGGVRTDSVGTTEPLVADGPHVVVELCAGVACPEPDADAEQELLAELDADSRVASTLLVTSDQAYELFLDEFGDQQDLVESIDPANVPAFIELELYDPEVASEVVTAYQDHEGVAAVSEAGVLAP